VKIARFFALLVAATGWLGSGTARADATPGPNLDLSTNLDVSALVASNARLYVGSFEQGLYVLEHGRTLRPVSDAALSLHINALAWSEPDQVLWVGSARGLTRCPAGKSCTRLGPESGVHAIAISTSGEVVAGGDAGLVFVEGDRVRTYGKKDGAPFRSVWALAEANGRLFAGTTNGLFWGTPTAFSGKHAALGRAAIVLGTLPDDWVTALSYEGDTLVSGTYSAGLAAFRATPAGLVSEDLDASPGYVNPAGITRLETGCIAVATMDGLRLGRVNETILIPTRARDVTAFISDPNGGYWIGTRAGVEFWDGACPSEELGSKARS
jgi:ligand-binding sensor domain-containing protein